MRAVVTFDKVLPRVSTTNRENHDVATFGLRYRTKKDLHILGIIPRSPSPAEIDDEQLDSLNTEQIRALYRKVKARKELHVRIKQERNSVSQEYPAEGLSSQTHRGVKRPRAPTLDEEDAVEAVEERIVRRRSRPPPAEITDISDRTCLRPAKASHAHWAAHCQRSPHR
jgi:hypothetical protein